MAVIELLVRVSVTGTGPDIRISLKDAESMAKSALSRALARNAEGFKADFVRSDMEGEVREVVVMPMKAVIAVSGGLVREVTGMPNRTIYEIHDYDVEVDANDLIHFPDQYGRDDEGQVYFMQEV